MSNPQKPEATAVRHTLSREMMSRLKRLPQFAHLAKSMPKSGDEALWRAGVQAVFDALEEGFVIDLRP
jgi:hypothetical protein